MFYRLLIGLVVLLALWQGIPRQAVSHADALLAPGQPDQQSMATPMMFAYHGGTLVAVATYHLRARVLGRKDYRMDPMAQFSPTDLALGWDVMSNPSVTDRIRVTQSNRWYYWHTASLHVSRQQIEQNSANVHILPADDTVKGLLQAVRPGQVVDMTGYLVNAMAPNKMNWRSSTTRGDVGAGSCEIFYVQKLR